MYVCVCVYIYNIYLYIFTYIYIHIYNIYIYIYIYTYHTAKRRGQVPGRSAPGSTQTNTMSGWHGAQMERRPRAMVDGVMVSEKVLYSSVRSFCRYGFIAREAEAVTHVGGASPAASAAASSRERAFLVRRAEERWRCGCHHHRIKLPNLMELGTGEPNWSRSWGVCGLTCRASTPCRPSQSCSGPRTSPSRRRASCANIRPTGTADHP